MGVLPDTSEIGRREMIICQPYSVSFQFFRWSPLFPELYKSELPSEEYIPKATILS
jgi:hypothetical protein